MKSFISKDHIPVCGIFTALNLNHYLFPTCLELKLSTTLNMRQWLKLYHVQLHKSLRSIASDRSYFWII